NFEGRISPDVKMNYLASPPLVVAYAIAGTMDIDLQHDSLGQDQSGNDVFLRDIWPSSAEVARVVEEAVQADMFRASYASVFDGDDRWRALNVPTGDRFAWSDDSTYIAKAPYFEGMAAEPGQVTEIEGAKVLALLGDSVTTDHISPAGAIKADSPAGRYLQEQGVEIKDFNSYGSRRGNHEVMIRGTFANIRLSNQVLAALGEVPSGGYTRDFTQPGGPQAFIYDAAQNYQKAGIPLVVLGGKEYGSGSSRDWAAKGTTLLGVRAVITESFERIHRSNLIGMGVIPLQFPAGESAASLKLDGTETFDITGIKELNTGKTPKTVHVTATKEDGSKTEFEAVVRIDTPGEADYYRNGGILQYVLRNMLKA
ncbi:MAG TPA: aconitate hydratase, partial [Mycobacterium sp.]|nr:aconitate hydratase [Mycobacterium sp.]